MVGNYSSEQFGDVKEESWGIRPLLDISCKATASLSPLSLVTRLLSPGSTLPLFYPKGLLLTEVPAESLKFCRNLIVQP